MSHDSIPDGAELLALLHERLAARIGRDRYAVWFGAGVELRCDAGRVSVAAADRFSTERLRKSFRRDLEAIVRELRPTNPHIEVEFIVDDALKERATNELAPAGPPRKEAAPDAAALRSADDAALPGAARRFARLEDFVVGDENRVAHAAALSTPARLGTVSPLFFYGPTGSGKTHLLEGVWSDVRRMAARVRCVYLSAEQFTTYFLEALQGSGLPSFRRKYREVQLLAIDDVQFFAGKRATMVELLHTFDTIQRGGQLVLSADRPPSELSGLGPELTARMAAGLVCRLAPPECEGRRAILERLMRQRRLETSPEVLDVLAERLPGDARRLAGSLNRLQATSEALRAPITLDLATRALADLFSMAQRPVELLDIERAVCEVFGMERPDLQSPRKAKGVAQPRMLAMWLARKHTRAALQDICHYFGRRSHTTVISAEKAVATWIEAGAVLQLRQGACEIGEAIRRVEARLGAG